MLRMFQVETNRLPPMLLVIFLSKEKFTITLNVSVTIRVRHRFFGRVRPETDGAEDILSELLHQEDTVADYPKFWHGDCREDLRLWQDLCRW